MLWRLRVPILIFAVAWSILFAGCARTETILVPEGTPVQVREPIPRVKVWVFDGDGQKTPGEIDIPIGWWALPDPDDG